MATILTKRAYEPATTADGYRVLVDRLWPRGLTHQEVDCAEWAKQMAPSTELREWFHADPQTRWDGFAQRYTAELEANPGLPAFLASLRGHQVITLVYGSRDETHNEATVLQRFLSQRLA